MQRVVKQTPGQKEHSSVLSSEQLTWIQSVLTVQCSIGWIKSSNQHTAVFSTQKVIHQLFLPTVSFKGLEFVAPIILLHVIIQGNSAFFKIWRPFLLQESKQIVTNQCLVKIAWLH